MILKIFPSQMVPACRYGAGPLKTTFDVKEVPAYSPGRVATPNRVSSYGIQQVTRLAGTESCLQGG